MTCRQRKHPFIAPEWMWGMRYDLASSMVEMSSDINVRKEVIEDIKEDEKGEDDEKDS